MSLGRRRVRRAVRAAVKRGQDCDTMETRPAPSTPRPSCEITSSTDPSPASGTVGRSDDPFENEQELRRAYLQVFTGHTLKKQLTSHSSCHNMKDESGSSSECTKCTVSTSTTTTTTTAIINAYSEDGDKSSKNYSESTKKSESCVSVAGPTNKQNANGDNHLPSEICFLVDFLKAKKVSEARMRRAGETGTLFRKGTQQSACDSRDWTERRVSQVQSVDVLYEESSQSLPDRIEQARRRCNTMRSDINNLSTRCDSLFAQLRDIRTRLASVAYTGLSAASATVTTVSLAVVTHSYSVLPSSALGEGTRSAYFSSSSRPGLRKNDLVMTASPQTSLSIVERVGEELSLRLDRLTAYVSSSEVPLEDSEDDDETSVPSGCTVEVENHRCQMFTEAVASSSGSQPTSDSGLDSAGKGSDSICGHDVLLDTSSGELTPPLSDDSSLHEDLMEAKDGQQTVVFKQEMAPWSDHSAGMHTTPILSIYTFLTDCHTPAIEALTCLESFSDSGKLTFPAPMADPWSRQSSTMMDTPPCSDQSDGSDDQRVHAEKACHLASQSGINSISSEDSGHSGGDPPSSTDCSGSDWKDYFTDSHSSCPSSSLEFLDAAVSTHHACKEHIRRNTLQKLDSSIARCMDEYHHEDGEVTGHRFPVCSPLSKSSKMSEIQEPETQNLLKPQVQSIVKDLNRNRNENASDRRSEFQQQQTNQQLKSSWTPLKRLEPNAIIKKREDATEDSLDGMDSSPDVLDCLPEIGPCKLIISTPPRSTFLPPESEHKQQNTITRPTKTRNPRTLIPNTVNQITNVIPKASLSPESKLVSFQRISETCSCPQGQYTTDTSKTTTGFAATIDTDTDDPEVSLDSYNNFLWDTSEPVVSQELLPAGVSQTAPSVNAWDSLHRQARMGELREASSAGKWRPRQKRIRQHRSALHLQHLSMSHKFTRHLTLSQVRRNAHHSTNDGNSQLTTVQSYNALEGISCGFNFLRNGQSQSQGCLTDVDSYAPDPNLREHRSAVYSVTTHSDTAPSVCHTTDSTQRNQPKTTISSQQSSSTKQHVPASDDYPLQHDDNQNKKRIVSQDGLKSRNCKGTEMKAVPGNDGTHATGPMNRAADLLRCDNEEKLQDGANGVLKSEITASTTSTTQNEASTSDIREVLPGQGKTLSNATYCITGTQTRQMLSCIVEDESEEMAMRNSDGSHKVDCFPHSVETIGGHVMSLRSVQMFPSKAMKALSADTAGVVQVSTPEMVGDRYKAVSGCSSPPQRSDSVTALKQEASQDNSVIVSFESYFDSMNPSAPALAIRNCEVLTSTPVVSSQKTVRQTDAVVRAFFPSNHYVEQQSCSFETSENAHLISHISQIHSEFAKFPEMHDSDTKNRIVVNCVQRIHEDTSSQFRQTDRYIDHTTVKNSSVGMVTKSDVQSHAVIQSNLMPAMSDNEQECYSCVSARSNGKNDMKAFVVTGHVGFTDAGFSSRKKEMKIFDHIRNVPASGSMDTVKELGSSHSNHLNMGEKVQDDNSSEAHKRFLAEARKRFLKEARKRLMAQRAKTHSKATKRDEHKVDSETSKTDHVSQQMPDGNHGPDDDTDRPEAKPRPKPLLPTPAYRRSPLTFHQGGRVPPCPHCLNYAAFPAPSCPPGNVCAVHWAPLPQGALNEDCVEAPCTHTCQSRQKPVGECCLSWARPYNGPAAFCVDHGGLSRPLPPPCPAAPASDNSQGSLSSLCLLEQPPCQRHHHTKCIAGTKAKPYVQDKAPEIQSEFIHQLLQLETKDSHQHPLGVNTETCPPITRDIITTTFVLWGRKEWSKGTER